MPKPRFIPQDFNAAGYEIEKRYADWFKLFDDVTRFSLQMCGGKVSAGTDSEKWGFYTLSLLRRTMGNANGAMTMLRFGMIIEARVLARCVLENFLFSVRLMVDNQTFADKMFAASQRSEQTYLTELLSLDEFKQQKNADELKNLEERVNTIINNGLPKDSVKITDITKRLQMPLMYSKYRKMSADAVHTGTISLKIYSVPTEVEGIIRQDYVPHQGGIILAETLDTILVSLIGQLIPVNYFFRETRDASLVEIIKFYDRLDQLRTNYGLSIAAVK